MQLNKSELILINYVLQMKCGPNWQETRTFTYWDLLPFEIFQKLNESKLVTPAVEATETMPAIPEKKEFVDCDIDFTTDEKSKILEFLRGMQFSLGDMEFVRSLFQKLS